MKKTIKRIALTITILLALIGAAGTVALASGYITWGGSEDYSETLATLEDIERRSNELGTERGQMINHILHLEAEIEDLEAQLEDGSQTDQDQLQQAEKDMEHLNERSKEVLENLQEAFSR